MITVGREWTVEKMAKCAYCKYTDGVVYTSMPPKYKCTITGEYHFANDDCDVEFAPVKHGRWIGHDIGSGERSIDKDECSECGARFYQIAETGCVWKHCPNCGAKMDLDEVEE